MLLVNDIEAALVKWYRCKDSKKYAALREELITKAAWNLITTTGEEKQSYEQALTLIFQQEVKFIEFVFEAVPVTNLPRHFVQIYLVPTHPALWKFLFRSKLVSWEALRERETLTTYLLGLTTQTIISTYRILGKTEFHKLHKLLCELKTNNAETRGYASSDLKLRFKNYFDHIDLICEHYGVTTS